VEAARYLIDEGYEVIQAIAVVDRSDGKAEANFAELDIPHTGIILPHDLGVAT
jgi:orotate phosphoribosyltransferase